MGNNWIQNFLILGLLIAIVGGTFNYFLSMIGVDFDLGFFIIAYILGTIYTKKVREVMPKELKIKTVSLFFISYLIILFLFTYFIAGGQISVMIFAMGFASIFLILESLIIYWIFGYAGRLYMKSHNKQ